MKRNPPPRIPLQLGKPLVDIAIGKVPDALDDGKNIRLTECVLALVALTAARPGAVALHL